jgi:chloramphenicol-sensitive protein RarD
VLYGASAYALWGLFPLYWPLLQPSGAVEVLAHRIVWSLVAVGLLLALTRRLTQLKAAVRDRRRLVMITGAAFLLALNWGTYIYGVNNERVVETSLGYFINPIVTVLLGVLILGERLRPAQWTALGAAAVAVVYGLLKKTAGVGAVEGLAIETGVLVPVAAVYLAVLGASGAATFGTLGVGHAVLMALSGIFTAVPLLLFGAAAGRVPLTTLGLLQYLAPTLQFLLGITLFDEPLPVVKLLGFVLVWVGLALFTADLVRHSRRTRRAALAVPQPA